MESTIVCGRGELGVSKTEAMMRRSNARCVCDETYDVLRGSAGKKDFGYAGFFQGRDVRSGIMRRGLRSHRSCLFVEQGHELRAKRVVCAR